MVAFGFYLVPGLTMVRLTLNSQAKCCANFLALLPALLSEVEKGVVD
jgi:hypothetical protein